MVISNKAYAKRKKFNKVLEKALKDTGAPPWETKKRVPKNYQARIVITPGIHNVIKAIAKRNRTGLATVVRLNSLCVDVDTLTYKHQEFISVCEERMRSVTKYQG